MENHWQELWNNRKINFSELNVQDEQQLILELKRIVGWDFKNTSIAADEFRKEYEYIKDNLGLSDKKSGGGLFEVGCGSGANLYFFHKDGFKVGGLDYAENLLAVAKKVVGEENLIECIAGEAIDLPTGNKIRRSFCRCCILLLPRFELCRKSFGSHGCQVKVQRRYLENSQRGNKR